MRRAATALAVATAIVAWGGGGSVAHAQSSAPDTPPFVFDGTVNDVVPTADGAYVGGDFDAQIPAAQGGVFAAVDGAGAVVPGGFPSVDGTVRASADDGAGGVYIGGTFTRVGAYARTNLAHVRADGTVDSGWAPDPGNTVVKLIRSGGRLAVGTDDPEGRAPTVLDTATGRTDPSFQPQIGGGITDFAIDGGRLYVAGEVDTFTTTVRLAVALDLATGTILPWVPEPSYSSGAPRWDVRIAVTKGVAMISSSFQATDLQRVREAYDTGTAERLWTISGSRFEPVTGIAGTDGRFFIATANNQHEGGSLLMVDAASGEVRWTVDLATAPGAPFAFPGTVYLGGVRFGTDPAATGYRRGAAAYDAATGALTGWRPYLGRPGAATLTLTGGRVFAGGAFAGAGTPVGQVRDLARIRRDGTLDPAFDAGLTVDPPSQENRSPLPPVVWNLALDGGTLFVQGNFDAVRGTRRARLAGLDVATGALTSLSATNTPTHPAPLAATAGKVFLGTRVYPRTGTTLGDPVAALAGATTAAVGGSTLYLGTTALDTGTLASLPWAPAPSPATVYADGGPSTVRGVTPAGDRVFVAGGFSALRGVARRGIGAVDPVSGAPTTWDADADGAVDAIATDVARVYVAGGFRRIGGEGRAGVAALDPVTARAAGWAPAPDGTVGRIVAGGGRVFLVGGSSSGSFKRIGGTVTGGVAQFTLPDTQADLQAGLKGLLTGLHRSGDGALGAMVVPAAGRVTVGLTVGSTLVSIGTAVATAPGPLAVPVPLNDVGRLILSVYPAFRFSGLAIFTPAAGGAATVAAATAGVAPTAR